MFPPPAASPGGPQAQGKNNIQNSSRQRPTLGFGSEGFNSGVIFRLPLSQSPALACSLPHSVSLTLSQRDLVFVKGTNGNFQLGERGEGRGCGGGECKKTPTHPPSLPPSKDSIRRDQIRALASSAPRADSRTMCPIWASGSGWVGGRRGRGGGRGSGGSLGHRNQLHPHPWGPRSTTPAQEGRKESPPARRRAPRPLAVHDPRALACKQGHQCPPPPPPRHSHGLPLPVKSRVH